MSDLERRYRRLLALYPRAHRAAHGEEMLGVLLDGAGSRSTPGQPKRVTSSGVPSKSTGDTLCAATPGETRWR
ncbi:hypothetical protein ACWEHA_32680 [Amycolatopsis nivea]